MITKQRVTRKKGVASIFVVIFTTLLLSVITLGFVHIILSESMQTTNTNLSQSAYDSALAGIEDAKITIMKYHECVSNNDNGEVCTRVRDVMEANDGIAPKDCDVIRDAMGGRPEGEEEETIIQSENSSTSSQLGITVNQAYTCVLISEENDDFIAELRTDYRTKLVPLRVSSDNRSKINYIRFQWFSNADLSVDNVRQDWITSVPNPLNTNSTNNPNKGSLGKGDSGLFTRSNEPNSFAPPAISLQLIQTAPMFRLDDFNINYNRDSTNSGSLMLVPVPNTPNFSNAIANNAVLTKSTFAVAADKANNDPIPIKCANNNPSASDYLCSVTIGVPAPNGDSTRNQGSMFLRVAVPYGIPSTTFSVMLCETLSESKECSKFLPFVGVQAKVDSTGRANDLFRRVEARIELTDTHFPMPDFALQLSGEGNNEFRKNYWATINNWSGPDSGEVQTYSF